MERLDIPDISEVLLKGTTEPNEQARREAEGVVLGLLENNFVVGVCALGAVLFGEQNNPFLRKASASVLKNALSSPSKLERETKQKMWMNIDPVLRNQFKNMLLHTLHSSDRHAAEGASSVISVIALVELPALQWEDLIQILFDSITSNEREIHVKIASMKTIEYICEDVDLSCLGEKKFLVLTAVNYGMTVNREGASPELIHASIQAFLHCLDFIGESFADVSQRGQLMKTLGTILEIDDSEIQTKCLMCFVKIAHLYYSCIPDFIEQLFEITIKGIHHPCEDVAYQAIEFWTTIAEEELILLEDGQKTGDLCQKAMPFLFPHLLQSLTRREDYQYEIDQQNVATSAANCISQIAFTVGDDVLQHVRGYVADHINHADWKNREAATLVMGHVLEGLQESGMEMISAFIGTLFEHLKDQSIYVIDTTVWTLGRICQFHAEVVLPHYDTFLNHITPCLKSTPNVAINACFAIHNITMAFQESEELPTSPLSPYYLPLIQQLTETAYREDGILNQLRSSAFETITCIIKTGADDTVEFALKLLPFFCEKLQQTFSMQVVGVDDREIQIELQAFLNGVIVKISEKIGPLISELAPPILKMELAILESHRNVPEECLMVVGSLASAIEENFVPFLEHFIKYILSALSSIKETTGCTVAIGVIGDLSRSIKQAIVPFLEQIMQIYFDNLKSPEIDSDVKPFILSSFGDLAKGVGILHFEPYLESVLKILQAAARTTPEGEDEEDIETLNSIWASVFDAYTCISQCLLSAGRPFLLRNESIFIVQFMTHVYDSPHTSGDVMSSLVGTIGDLALLNDQNIFQALNCPKVREIVDYALASDSEELMEVGKWAHGKLMKCSR